MHTIKPTGRLSDDQIDYLRDCARELASGYFGGFAVAIGDAMLVADAYNIDRLRLAFPELIERAEERTADEEARRAIESADSARCTKCGEITHLSGLIGECATDCPRCGVFVC